MGACLSWCLPWQFSSKGYTKNQQNPKLYPPILLILSSLFSAAKAGSKEDDTQKIVCDNRQPLQLEQSRTERGTCE